jgi:hypothetical protein
VCTVETYGGLGGLDGRIRDRCGGVTVIAGGTGGERQEEKQR